jgi:hypothetical protein
MVFEIVRNLINVESHQTRSISFVHILCSSSSVARFKRDKHLGSILPCKLQSHGQLDHIFIFRVKNAELNLLHHVLLLRSMNIRYSSLNENAPAVWNYSNKFVLKTDQT